MIMRIKQNFFQMKLLPSITPSLIILKIITVLLMIFCITGCHTILTPPPDYVAKIKNQVINKEVDSVTYTNQYINNYYRSTGGAYTNSCSSIHWRYNSWTGTYYCDPYYYNYNYYNHHYNDYYWWSSYHGFDHYENSDNYSYSPSKKVKRNKSFTRISEDYVTENSLGNNPHFSTSQNDSYIAQSGKSSSVITEIPATNARNQQNNNNVKTRRKHKRKPL